MLKQYVALYEHVHTVGVQTFLFYSENPWKDFNKNFKTDLMSKVRIYLMKEIKE